MFLHKRPLATLLESLQNRPSPFFLLNINFNTYAVLFSSHMCAEVCLQETKKVFRTPMTHHYFFFFFKKRRRHENRGFGHTRRLLLRSSASCERARVMSRRPSHFALTALFSLFFKYGSPHPTCCPPVSARRFPRASLAPKRIGREEVQQSARNRKKKKARR